MKKIKKSFGFGAILASFIFIFNPNIHIIDLLPDAVGYLLLSVGLSQLADMNHYIEDSIKLFKRGFFLQCIKIAALFWIFGAVSIDDRASSLLTATFVFALLEAMLLIPAYNKLFSGIDYLSERGGFSVSTQKLRSYTTFFIVFKGVLNFLPELAALAQYKNENADQSSLLYRVDWFGNIDLLRAFAFIPALIICIIWLIKGIRAFSRIIKNTDFVNYLKEKYTVEILPQSELFLKKSVNFAFLLFSVGVLLTADFYLGISSGEMNDVYMINLIPDVFAVVCILVGVWGLWQYIPRSRKKMLGVGIVYALVSLAKEFVSTLYFREHTILDLRIDEEASKAYTYVKTAAIVEAVVFVAFIGVLILVLREIIAEHTGYAPITSNAAENRNTQEKIAYIHKGLYNKMKVVFAFGIAAAICNAAYYFMTPHIHYAWIINFTASIVFAVVFITRLFSVSDEIDYKYMI